MLLTKRPQILFGITCDNASANDAMIESLADLLPDFPGAANCTCCFTHILNLVAKCIMKQFDSPKSKRMGFQDDDVANNKMKMKIQEDLHALEEEIEEEDEETVEDDRVSDEEIDKMRRGMTGKEVWDLEKSIKLMCLVLTKVICLSNCHITLQLTCFSFTRLPRQSKDQLQ
jgi:hypothetical protein